MNAVEDIEETHTVGTLIESRKAIHIAVPFACSLIFLTVPLFSVGSTTTINDGLVGRDVSLPTSGSLSPSLKESYASLVNYSDVLVIRNVNSADSMTIADYFMSQRNLSWASICNVSTSTAEEINSATFDSLATQVKSCLSSLPPGTTIIFLVTTKGVPLKTWRSPGETYASVDSELALVGGPYESRIGNDRWTINPYFNDFVSFSRAAYGFYIATRLTAFTVSEATALVDNATVAIGRRGKFVFDVDPGKDGGAYQIGNDWMRGAATLLAARGFDVTLDETSTFLTNHSDVAGYSSWGSNDGTWYAAVNLNSGFEVDADVNGVPDNWLYDDPSGTANITRNNTVRESGQWSVRIYRPFVDGNVTALSENVSIRPERRYFAVGSANYTNVTGGRGLFLQLTAYDSMDNVVWTRNGSSLTGTSRWRGFPQIIYEPTANATHLTLSVVFAEANGTMFVDNVRLVEIRPHNHWIPGSLAETAVSTGGRSFTYGTGYGQSLVADLVRDGVTGVKGYVYEPYLNAVAHSNILFDAYTKGYTLGESYMMASEWALSWQDVIIGDPKLAPYNRSYLPDLAVATSDITFSDSTPYSGETIDFEVNVRNIGHFPATDATISFYLGDPLGGGLPLGNRTLSVPANSSATTSIPVDTTGLSGWFDLCIFVDSANVFYEADETNNVACSRLGVTSSYILRLPPGHRFVSFPLLPINESIESVLSSISGCYDYVRQYEASNLASPWKSYTPGRQHNSLLSLDNAVGFWINMTSDCNLNLTGVRPTVTVIALHTGWNMVGFPSFNATYTVADLKASLGLPGVRVEVLDPSAPPYYLKRATDTYAMSTGEGYWIFVPSNSDWIVTA